MERDQGVHGVLKPLARTSISEEIGRQQTGQCLHPSSALAAWILRSFGLIDWLSLPGNSRLQWSQVNWPSIILISWLWRPQVPGLDGPRGPGGA